MFDDHRFFSGHTFYSDFYHKYTKNPLNGGKITVINSLIDILLKCGNNNVVKDIGG